MWPDVVVMHWPVRDRCACILKAREPVQVQAVLCELAVKAFDESVLGWLTRLNEMELHARSPRPEEHGFRRELWAIIANDRPGKGPRESVELPSQSIA